MLPRVQRGVNAAIDHPGALLARQAADFISTQGVSGMNPDADEIAGLNACRNQGFEGLVHNDRVAKRTGSRSRQDI